MIKSKLASAKSKAKDKIDEIKVAEDKFIPTSTEDKDLELTVLSFALGGYADQVLKEVGKDDFTSQAYWRLMEIVSDMRLRGEEVNAHTFSDEYEAIHKKFDMRMHVMEWARCASSEMALMHAVRELKRKTRTRKAAALNTEIGASLTAGKAIDELVTELKDVTEGSLLDSGLLFDPQKLLAEQFDIIEREDEDEDIDTIFNECFTTPDLSLITGSGGSGKSMLTIKMAMALALGIPALEGHKDWFTPTKKGKTVFFIGEDDREIYIKRLKRLVKARGLSQEDLLHILANVYFVTLDKHDVRLIKQEGGSLERTDMVKIIGDTIRACDARLAVFDPLNRFNGAKDENDNATTNMFIGAVREVCSRAKCAILLVHHSGKGDSSNARGASSLVDGVRTHIAVSTLYHMKKGKQGVERLPSDRDYICITMEKSNHTAFWDDSIWCKREKELMGDFKTIQREPIDEGSAGGMGSKYLQVDGNAVKKEVVSFLLNTPSVPMNAMIPEIANGSMKHLCPDEGKAKNILREMIEAGMIEKYTMAGQTWLRLPNTTERFVTETTEDDLPPF
ncbi:replicative DNA helicase [Yersinia phage vB_YenM_636]|nr:replicative DNA helicase [Yersinia phage vB_Yen_X1]QKN86335.1 replicative DNA helicase [Yersinia phage vB_YenM_12]QKN86426.1 replicative DNA helicase [Yersinia phage vB_YenM_22]QKN86517.1 replicative DNA helicase [Yersinia phage vB_YenM_25]QKN86608.1 replicative DNA helicase [Yersinia phage vB_YenM_27]QKN86699.1 replicative DNA helicase [Yersinia phage vB_YenM_39]QKN86790.1 replicative DNA helicase [Yersinia phage vB_YenM_126]QKN86881.1 replicative DNA helicase [Yersinia phage vB_YenM_526